MHTSPETKRFMIERMDHLVITANDIEVTRQFYADILGMETVYFGKDHSRIAMSFGTQKINLHQYKKEFEPKAHMPTPGAMDLCFITQTPLEKVIAFLQEKSISIEEGPIMRTGALGPIHSIYIRDPDGNLIEISNYTSQGDSIVTRQTKS